MGTPIGDTLEGPATAPVAAAEPASSSVSNVEDREDHEGTDARMVALERTRAAVLCSAEQCASREWGIGI